jgi:hypothetical protein
MKDDDGDEEVGAPMMDVADQLTEEDVSLQRDDGIVGESRRRLVDEHQQDAGRG